MLMYGRKKKLLGSGGDEVNNAAYGTRVRNALVI